MPRTDCEAAEEHRASAKMEKTEPFPALDERVNRLLPEETSGASVEKKVQRRKSSGLGGEIRAGDTGVPAIATMELKTQSAGLLRVSFSAACGGVCCREDILTSSGRQGVNATVKRDHTRRGGRLSRY